METMLRAAVGRRDEIAMNVHQRLLSIYMLCSHMNY